MGKRQEIELRRLEEALLESDEMRETPGFWKNPPANGDHIVFNTDETDVDLDAFSEEVHRGKPGSALSVVLTMFAMLALSAAILILLKVLGVL